jgi:protein Mpv17
MVLRTRIVATLLLVTAVAQAFSYSAIPRSSRTTTFAQGATGPRSLSSIQQHSSNSNTALLSIRGGQQGEVEEPTEVLDAEDLAVTIGPTPTEEEEIVESSQAQATADSTPPVKAAGVGALGTMAASLARVGAFYGSALESSPVLTKSVTAGCIFALSDYLAQKFEASSSAADKEKKRRLNLTRIATSAAVGLFYFGPAAHVWYSWIFRILPGTSLFSILQKAALGQMFFGPSFTCIFFATGLLQSGTFSLGNWVRKIRQDLPGAWLAGASFWPLIDLVSFSLVPQKWIPLFVNMASLVWTIYLSTIANRGTPTAA